MPTPAEVVEAALTNLNADLEAITDPDELDAVADSMDAFATRYLTAAQASQLTDTAANMRAKAESLRPVTLSPTEAVATTSFPAAIVTAD